MIHPDTLLNWCQKQVALSDKVKIQDFTSSWKNGLALCTILHHYRPDLMDISALDPENISKNNQLVRVILLKLHLPNTKLIVAHTGFRVFSLGIRHLRKGTWYTTCYDWTGNG